MNALRKRAEVAARLWGNGLTADDLIDALHPDEFDVAATSCREFWKTWTIALQTPSEPPTKVWAEVEAQIEREANQ